MPKKKSYWLSSGKFSLFERLSILFFGVLGFYLLVRIFDKNDYGTWILYITVINFLDTARHGFFKNPLIRYLGLEENKEDKTLSLTSLTLNLISSSLLTLLFVIASYPISTAWEAPALIDLFLIHLVTNVGLTFFYHYEYILKSNFNFKGSAIGYFTKGLFFFGCIAAGFFFKINLTLPLLGWCYCISAFIGAIVSFIYARPYINVSIVLKNRWVKELMSYGKYTLGTNISAVLLRYTDTWMLGFYLNPVAVALYNVATRIANLFEVPSMTLASIIFPKAVKDVQNQGKEAFKNLYEKSVAVILILTIPFVIVVMFLGEQIILFLAGEAYLDSVMVLKITILYGLFVPFNKQMGVLLDAMGKAKKNTLFVARNAVINVILNAIAIPIFGLEGAAYATLSTFVLVMIINQFYMSKNFNVELTGVLRHMFVLVNRGRKLVAKSVFPVR